MITIKAVTNRGQVIEWNYDTPQQARHCWQSLSVKHETPDTRDPIIVRQLRRQMQAMERAASSRPDHPCLLLRRQMQARGRARQGVARMTVWYEIKTLDGRTLSRTNFRQRDFSKRWEWVLDNITTDAECRETDVDVEEAEDGDYVTVRGARYAQVSYQIV